MREKMKAVKKAGGKMRPMTMREFEGTKEDKKVDRAALKKINQGRKK